VQHDTQNHYLMHCRPRLEFHLGHVHALSHLHQLLVQGHCVTVLVIPFDEHEAHNRTFRLRLQEDVELTKVFYRNFLGFESPQLTVVSTYDIEISPEDIERMYEVFQQLYRDDDSVRRLVEVHGRTWASIHSKFVAKCICSIKRFHPTHTTCGSKHQLISLAFKAMLSRSGVNVEEVFFSDLLDLTMSSSMDNKDTAHTVVEITDNDDFVFHKLSLQQCRTENKVESWLDHFSIQLLPKVPARLTQNVPSTCRTTAEKEIALVRFLANVRRLIPYVQQATASKLEIQFNGTYRAKKDQAQISRYSELIRRVYASENVQRVEVSKEYTDGASPTTVFEVRERTTDASDHVANLSVLKFGDSYELGKERAAYEAIVRPSKTSGFAEVKGFAGPYERMGALRYQSAEYFMGASSRQHIRRLCDLYSHSLGDDERSRNLTRLFRFLDEHLFQALWNRSKKLERRAVSDQYNVFLPARYSVFIDHRDPVSGDFCKSKMGDTQTLLSMQLRVTEYHSDLKRVRAYTVDSGQKVDVFYGNLDEQDTQQFREGNVLSVRAEVRKERRDTFERLLKEDDDLRRICEGKPHPEEIAQDLLAFEFEAVHHGPIHGDLHCGNIITTGDSFCVIDYGKTSASGLVAHDIAMLLSDLHLKTTADQGTECHTDMFSTIRKFFQWRPDVDSNYFVVLDYGKLSNRIRQIVDEKVFWASLALTFLGTLKFPLSVPQRRVCLRGAYDCYERFQNL